MKKDIPVKSAKTQPKRVYDKVRTEPNAIFRERNLELTRIREEIFKSNVLHVIRSKGYTITSVFDSLNYQGIKTDRKVLYPGNDRRFQFTLLFVNTLCRILDVDFLDLFNPDLPKYYKPEQKTA